MPKLSAGACVVVLAILMGASAGCSSNAKVEAKSTTVGQELQDLENAHDKGLITDDEYQKQRQKILKGN